MSNLLHPRLLPQRTLANHQPVLWNAGLPSYHSHIPCHSSLPLPHQHIIHHGLIPPPNHMTPSSSPPFQTTYSPQSVLSPPQTPAPSPPPRSPPHTLSPHGFPHTQ